MSFTTEELLLIVPHCHDADAVCGALNVAMLEFSINTPLRQSAFVAQLAHESGSFRYVRELASGSAYDDRDDLGNTKPEAVEVAHANNSTPGRWWKGHGYIQVTGYDNHKKCGEYLGLDLINHPELLELPVNAARSAGWFWNQRRLNELADEQDFLGITKRINGGTNGFDERMAFYTSALTVLEA